MQKTINQRLGGTENIANREAKYTWKKDEEAWYFCSISRSVFKIKFTGKHWLAGNKWKRQKIYEFEYLESSNPSKNMENTISHQQEHVFYTSKTEAIAKALRYIKHIKTIAIKKIDAEREILYAYRKIK